MSRIPDNRAEFSLADVLSATRGRLLGSLPSEQRFVGVGTDTRAALAGKLFVALSGERFDAHTMLDQAASAGAVAALVERNVAGAPLPTIEVRSTLHALGDLARLHRRSFGGVVIAVAGSAGKTTTRSAIGALLELSAPGRVHQVAGNLNNLIGVPHVLFGLSDQRFAVIEIGTNVPGEVARLTSIVEPDVAVLTLIALEHSEGLGDLDGVEREEGALFASLPGRAVAVGNVDDERVRRQLDRCQTSRKIGYGFGVRASLRGLGRRAAGLGAQRLTLQTSGARRELDIPLLGEAGAYATLAAAAVGEALGLDLTSDGAAVTRALAAAGEAGRLRPVLLADGSVVVDDSYNSNPASVLSSMAAAREIAGSARLILVLGEMRELGAQSVVEHRRVGEALAGSGASLVVAVSGDAEHFVAPARAAGLDAVFTSDANAALELVRGRLQPGDVVLVKASRGVRAERVVEGLIAERGRAA